MTRPPMWEMGKIRQYGFGVLLLLTELSTSGEKSCH